MIGEILAIVGWEIGTTTVSLLGFKALNGEMERRLHGLNLPKPLPFIDKYLKHELGLLSKREQWIANKIVVVTNRISQYEAFKLLLILAGRRIQSENSNVRAYTGNSSIPARLWRYCRVGIR